MKNRGLLAALLLLLGSAFVFGQTLDSLSEEQIKARAAMVWINDEHDAHVETPLFVPNRVYLDGREVTITRDEKDHPGSCVHEAIRLSPYLRAESTRHALWHEIKHYCLNRCDRGVKGDPKWLKEVGDVDDAIIESTGQCEVDAMRDNPALVEFLTDPQQPTPKSAGKKKAAKKVELPPLDKNGRRCQLGQWVKDGYCSWAGTGTVTELRQAWKCNHSKLQSCASQANEDYGPGRSGLVGEMTLDPNEPVGKYLQDAPKPIDVPAIQETRKDEPNCSMSMIAGGKENGWSLGRGWDGVICGNEPTFSTAWTCPDKHSYTLQTSVDGEVRICHRINYDPR